LIIADSLLSQHLVIRPHLCCLLVVTDLVQIENCQILQLMNSFG